ncbi:hypothetical protein KQY27_06870 [Methanobrevibacter sp. TMH8]|uniref:hypothetical protein n=1 Tax=Methanobrevibacter sp. TMH8 TaxID=2848611 RepID=UPI001CCD426D|nr:hypothetical protein [Methanobrevibacter sp. TMH8]MBZ9571263.1 hypothetical protein [Methanobrevibacter sp. TMH8]
MFKIFDKSNKKGFFYLLLIGIVVILVVTMIGSANAATYTISTNNSTSSINSFFKNNVSPLAKGDTVIFKAGQYDGLNLKVNKSITLKTSGKVTVKSIRIFKNTKISGFIVNKDFLVKGKSNIIVKNTIKGFLMVKGDNNTIRSNKVFKGCSIYVPGSYISGGKNKVISNTFKKGVEIRGNSNKITGNKVGIHNKIFVYGKKNILKNNKQFYRDLVIKDLGKSSKGHLLSVKNVGTIYTLPCYILVDKYTKVIYKIKIPALKKGKSIKVIIPKKIINILQHKSKGESYSGGYIMLDYIKNKNKDLDLSNNCLQIISDKNGYIVTNSMQ